jgi:hypothetical protein
LVWVLAGPSREQAPKVRRIRQERGEIRILIATPLAIEGDLSRDSGHIHPDAHRRWQGVYPGAMVAALGRFRLLVDD